MEYDPQVNLFLKSITNDPAPNGTKTQKLVALLQSNVAAHVDGALNALASATTQGNNAELAKGEGLIPVFLDQLVKSSPQSLQHAAFGTMMLSSKESNREEFSNSKWTNIIETLQKIPSPPPNPEIVKNLLSSLHFLSLHEKLREELGQKQNLKVVLEFADKKSNPVYLEKAVSVFSAICNTKSARDSILEIGGTPTLVTLLKNPNTAIWEAALKGAYYLTSVDKNRDALRKADVLSPLLSILDLPTPASDNTLNIALRTLSNLAVDDATAPLLANSDFKPLVKLMSSSNQNMVLQTAAALQNLVTESTIPALVRAGAYEAIIKTCKSNAGYLPRFAPAFSIIIVDGEVQSKFVETGGAEFLLSLFNYNDADLHKQACRGIANVTGLYDDIRAGLGTDTGIKHLLRLAQGSDKPSVDGALNALVNLVRYEPVGELLNKIGGIPLISQLVDSKDKATAITASMVLVNLSTHRNLNALLSSMGWVDKAVGLLANPDPDMQVQAAKLITNFAGTGRNRKYMHEKGLVTKIKAKLTGAPAALKNQLDIASNNLSFPYEERYEGLDFALEEKISLAAGQYNYEEEDLSDEEDDSTHKERKIKIDETKVNLENERKRIEKERKEAESKLKQEQLLREKKKKEEEEALKKKKVEEEKQRALKKKQDEERLKKVQEDERRRVEEEQAAAIKAAEERKKIEAEEEKRRAEEEEKKKKKAEEKQRRATVSLDKAPKLKSEEDLAAKIKRQEERRLRNEDRQKRRDAKAKMKLEKAQRKEEKQKKKVEKAAKRAERTAQQEAERIQKEKQEEEVRLKAENEERIKKEKQAAEEEARLKKEHEEREKKRKEDMAALEKMEAELKQKEEELKNAAPKEADKGKDKEKEKAEKRVKITQEIVSVEQGYVRNLGVAIRKFLNPLTLSASTKRPILTLEKVKAIFSIIEIIYNYNSLLLEGLESRMKRWIADNKTTPLCFGDIFVKMTDYMACYSTYINNYNTSMETLLDAKKNNPAFSQFLHKAEADPECRMQELSSFIINPIQQLPRYIMLLSDLLRNTPADHPDYSNIATASEKMKKLTEHVNEQKRESETTAAIVNVQHRLRGKVPQLLIPFRKLVKEGPLSFGDQHGIKEKEGYVFLFNDMIVLAKQKKDQTLTYKDSLSLHATSIEDLKDDQVKNTKNAFFVKGNKNVLISTKTPADKTTWTQKITASIAGKA